MAQSRKSLREFYPKHPEVLLLLILATAALVFGLSLPLVKVEKLLLVKRATNVYSVYTGVVNLWEQREYFLAAVIFFFSMVFPFGKLVALSVIWFFKLADSRRKSFLRWLEALGKWSMLDVFIVSILIVAVKLKPLVSVEAKPGVYVFALAILLSMVTTMWVDQLAKKALRS